MTRSSSAVVRAAAIIDFMAEHPNQSFTMADLVRALKVSQSTCHSLLNALVQVGYLYRTNERTYVLGPALASIGRIAADRFSPLQIAHPEMRMLADRFDAACAATFREGDWSVVRDRATSARKLGATAELGTPVRLRAPVAALYFAWCPEEGAEWLARADLPDRETERVHLDKAASIVREQGYGVFLKGPGLPPTFSPEHLFDGDLDTLPFRLAETIEPDGMYDVSSLAAPVVVGGGRVEFMISMRGFDNPMTATQIREAADALKSSCARISSFCTTGRSAPTYSPV